MLPVIINFRCVSGAPGGDDGKALGMPAIQQTPPEIQAGLFAQLPLGSLPWSFAPLKTASHRLPEISGTGTPQHQYLARQGIDYQ